MKIHSVALYLKTCCPNIDAGACTLTYTNTFFFGAEPLLLQLIKKNTRITNTTATCIDLCYTNSNIVAKAKVWDVTLSDHELILITRKKGSTP